MNIVTLFPVVLGFGVRGKLSSSTIAAHPSTNKIFAKFNRHIIRIILCNFQLGTRVGKICT